MKQSCCVMRRILDFLPTICSHRWGEPCIKNKTQDTQVFSMLSIISQALETSLLHAEYLGYGMICDGSAKTILENSCPLLSCHISGIFLLVSTCSTSKSIVLFNNFRCLSQRPTPSKRPSPGRVMAHFSPAVRSIEISDVRN